MELDCGPHRGQRTIVIPYGASGRLRVRHPQFEPGYLFDAIGIREDGATHARLPATSQPPYRWTAVPPPPPGYSGVQSRISGTATWSDTFDFDEQGAAYPMLERSDTACDDAGVSCAGLPYLSLGFDAQRAQRVRGTHLGPADRGMRLHGRPVLRSLPGMRHLPARPDRGAVADLLRGTRW